ncbi:MAG: class I SAM-dependent methyltransferase [Lachnospiraceae bacterium]|nr:class I SAM-dependent methyltransferase [Lachnospiraceae bacterium]
MKLSDRLKAVAGMVTPGLKVADVGCDHGHLAIYLIEKKISPYVYAMDINRGPIDRAIINIMESGYSSDIKTILGDGLTELNPGDAGSIVMAGMGGPLMVDIIKASPAVCEEADELILQPQSDIALVRHYLQDKGYLIISEDMICEDDKFYPMIKAVHGEMDLQREVFFRYGRILIRERNPILLHFLYLQRKSLNYIRDQLLNEEQTERVTLRLSEIERDIAFNQEAINLMEKTNPIEIDRILK